MFLVTGTNPNAPATVSLCVGPRTRDIASAFKPRGCALFGGPLQNHIPESAPVIVKAVLQALFHRSIVARCAQCAEQSIALKGRDENASQK